MASPEQDWNDWLAENAARFLLFARQQTRCEHDAEDVLQESLVESWQRAGGRPEAALVYATIRRRAIDLGRSNSRRSVREQESSDLFSASSEDRETAEVLERELCRLPPDDRLVLTLLDLEQRSVAEISGLTGWSRALVKVRAFRARLRLKALVGKGDRP